MSKSDALSAEMHRIREILGKINNPYDRYQLTLLLETAARSFVSSEIGEMPHKTRKGRRSCKTDSHSLPN